MARINREKAAEIKRFIEKWRNYWKDNINIYDEWTQFVMGSQWLDDEARVFDSYQKTPMTQNKIAPLKNHLVGEQRQNTPSLQVIPDDKVPEETAEVREALVKDISFNSPAKIAYQTAFECAVVGGYGAFEVSTEYDNDMDFNQHAVIKPKTMPNWCFWDVGAQTPAKTDGMGCGHITRISRAKCTALYGKKVTDSCVNSSYQDGIGTVINDDDAVSEVNYWERIYSVEIIRQLSNGRSVNPEEYKLLDRIEIDGKKLLIDNDEPVTIINTRSAPRYKVKHYKFIGDYEIESQDFPSKQLPLVFVDQNSFLDKTGKQIIRPFFKDTYDAQRTINYIATQSVYLMKISRYDQFIVSKQNVRSPDTSAVWRNPTLVRGALLYDESPAGNRPEQLRPAELPMFLVQQYERALMDIQTSTGMYNAQLGQQGNEVSGAAVDARTKRGAYGTYTPFDGLNRGIAAAGEIINEMIPHLYDTERDLTLNMPDRGETKITINKPLDDYGSMVQHDMTQGKYTVRIIPGPSWEGQKQENLESMQQVLQANPQLFNLIADLYVENLPLANNIELKNRLRTIVPPEIIEAGKTGQPIPPKPQQPDPMLMVKMKELEIKQQQVQQAQQKLQLDAQAQGQEIQIEYAKLEAEKLEAAAELQETQLRYAAELQNIQSKEEMNHSNNLIKLLTHKMTERTRDNGINQR